MYVITAGLFIAVADWFVGRFNVDAQLLEGINAAKDAVYIAVSAGLLFWLLTRRDAPEEGAALRNAGEVDFDLVQRVGQIGSWSLDASLNNITWSAECYRIYGLPKGTPINFERFIDLVHPEDRTDLKLKWKAALQGEAYDFEHRTVINDEIKWIRERAETLYDDSQNLIGVIGTSQDITERKIIEIRLQESETVLRQSQLIAGIGHYVFDIETGIWTSSEVLNGILGIGDLPDKNVDTWLGIVHPDHRDEMLAYLSNHVLRDLETFDREYRIVRVNDGTVRWLHGLGRLEIGKDGKPKRMLGTIQDVTERVEVETALRESEERLRQAISISNIGIFDHDQKTAKIYGSTELRRIFGFSADTAISMELFLQHIHADDRASLAMNIQKAHDPSGSGQFDCEYRIVLADGEIRWVVTKSKTLFEATEGILRPARTVGAVMDITERKQAEMVLLESKERYQALEERFRIIYEGALDGILLVDIDSTRFVMANPALARMLGYDPEEIPDLRIADIVRESDLDFAMDQFKKHVMGVSPLTTDMPLKRKNGDIVYVDAHSATVRVDGKDYQLGILRDVSDRRKNEERLRLAATVFDSSHEGIMVVDADRRILMVNRAFCELQGYAEDELLDRNPSLFRSGRHDDEFYGIMWRDISTLGHWQGEIWNRRKNGEVCPELVSISVVKDRIGSTTHYVGIYTDISHLKESEEKLEFMAHHDPLTQLPNRLLMQSRLQHNLEIAQREHRRLALLMLDLDRFKDVNDSFGHLAGDELLQQVSKRLLGRLRGVDTVARLGGDEFALLLDNPKQPGDVTRIADEIIAMLSEPWRLSNGAEIRIGTSVGISLYPEHGQTAEVLLQQVDAALYRAKSEGRGCARYFSDEMTQAARNRVELETELRRALNNNELEVYYQPQIDIKTHAVIGAEALIRWRNPKKGMISPLVFIPVAEETGLIGQIGEWVLYETCRQGKRWLDTGYPSLTLSVNLSAQQFLYGDIGNLVAKVLAETGFPAENLVLELTESVLMDREGEAEMILHRLRSQRILLAIDDFGTGYSSLAYLKRFPINVLKIDKGFIDDIPKEQDDMAITAAIIAMAHSMGFKVVAEGVETVEQLAFLESQGCDRYQGYLTSPAVPALAFEKFLVNNIQSAQSRAG